MKRLQAAILHTGCYGLSVCVPQIHTEALTSLMAFGGGALRNVRLGAEGGVLLVR